MGNPFKKIANVGKKIVGGAGKVVKKLVPKELAGIMQVAAPFTGAAAPFVYAAGAYKQSGKINPMALAAMSAPYLRFGGDQAFRYGSAQAGDYGIRNLLFGGRGVEKSLFDPTGFGGTADKFLFGEKGKDLSFGEERMVPGTGETEVARFAATKPTQGFLGSGGEFNLKSSKLLSSTDAEGNIKLSKMKIGAAASAGLSLAQTQAQIEEEGEEAGLGSSELAALQAEAAEMWEDFDTTQFKPKITAAIGGLMRKNLAGGTFNPATPKPGDYGVDENELKPEPKPFIPGPKPGNKVEITAEMMAQEYFGMSFNELAPAQQQGILELIGAGKPQAKQGGLMRTNYALGSMPTNEESGLGGLPIEADMRYSGGFMPYGKKEKADDVPARLSKNEFVFTADAVRAAGGGSIQKGAQKMYNSMKQLESMGRSVV